MDGDAIVATSFDVEGVHSDADVREALQELFDVFAQLGLGQATFEADDNGTARLIVKHKTSVVPDVTAISQALRRAGDFRLVD